MAVCRNVRNICRCLHVSGFTSRILSHQPLPVCFNYVESVISPTKRNKSLPIGMSWFWDLSRIGLFGSFIIFITVTLAKFFRGQNCREIRVRDITKGHRWCITEVFSRPAFCNICYSNILNGAFCDSCGICVDTTCLKAADRTLMCKSLASRGENIRHHWVHGNLPLQSFCVVCEEECGVLPELCDFRCCWCQITVHENCRPKIAEICDLGQYRDLIVPPNCVRLKLVGMKGRRHLVVGEVISSRPQNWSPLIVLGNRKSGGSDCEEVLRTFSSLLNPAQVIDLHFISPETALEWCLMVPNHVCKVLICGGDGTVGWVLNAIDKLQINPQPHVCILPLGTGNDLSRVLGWGEGYVGEIEIPDLMELIAQATPTKLDRWLVKIVQERYLGIRRPTKELFMNNYLSIGVDALVALNFHRQRESIPKLLASRLLNKLIYLNYGTRDVLMRECKDLHTKVKLELDGNEIEIPELEGIVVLNIPSWGAGVFPWIMGTGKTAAPPQSINDGKLEVFGLYSSFHIAQLQVGISEPVRLGQAQTVKITVRESNAPMQIDGEPWEQLPAEIYITHLNQATVLVNNKSLNTYGS